MCRWDDLVCVFFCDLFFSLIGRCSVMSFVGHEYQKERTVVPEEDEEDGHVDGMEDFVSPDGSEDGSDEGC